MTIQQVQREHIAIPMVDDVQRCARCNKVLLDYRPVAMSKMRVEFPEGFAPGSVYSLRDSMQEGISSTSFDPKKHPILPCVKLEVEIIPPDDPPAGDGIPVAGHA